MREIKFRAWKKIDDPEMFDDIAFIDWNRSLIGVNYQISSTKTRLDKLPLDNVIIEQYTGLKDKNGFEIYDGDIISFENEFDGFKNIIGVLKYTEYAEWAVSGILVSRIYTPLSVVGNIHENADLLEEQ